jgi:hypothetical protein
VMVNNPTSINKTKESLNSDGQQSHQYQQDEQENFISLFNLCLIHFVYLIGK